MNNLNGILMVIGAMAAFTLEDAFIKQLSGTLPVGQILLLLGIGSAFVFAVWATLKRHRLFAREAWQPLMLVRAGAEALSAMGYATALSLVDISTVAAVFQATPLVITMGAALFMGEQVGWRRWSAIFVGFVGVLLIIRPGLAGFDPYALFVLVAVFGVALRDLVTRRIKASVPSTVVSFQGFLALVVSGTLLLLSTPGELQVLNPVEWSMVLGGVLFGVLGYYGIVVAMRIGEASAVTPFRYTRLLFSLLVGIVVFRESPDALTLLGAGLVIATGLYTYLRERRIAIQARKAAA